MQVLNLISGGRILSSTVQIPDPSDNTKTITDSYPCDLDGNRLGQFDPPLPVFTDAFSGDAFVRVCENIPHGPSQADRDAAAKINLLKPIHFVSPDGDVKGWFVAEPNFDATAPSTADQAGSVARFFQK